MKKSLAVIGIVLTLALTISLLLSPYFLLVRPSVWHFVVVHFTGHLFFVFMPSELLVPYFLSYGFSPVLLFVLSLATALAALAIDYAIGRILPEFRLKEFVGPKRYGKYRDKLVQYEKLIVFFVAATPLSSPVLLLIAGMIRFSFRDAMLYTVAGLALKYLVIIAIYLLV